MASEAQALLRFESLDDIPAALRSSLRGKDGSLPKSTKNKMKNVPMTVDGKTYQSTHEGMRACELRLLERSGEIIELREQQEFILIPKQTVKSSVRKLERPVVYIADFTYFDKHGNFIVEDTKGHKTKDYIIKRKLMLFIHNIAVLET